MKKHPAPRIAQSQIPFPGKRAFLGLALLGSIAAQGATVVWTGESGDRNWATAGNWTGGTPASTNAIIFGQTDAQSATTPVNVIPESVTIASLAITNNVLGGHTSFHNNSIAQGQTLTLTGNLAVGAGSVQSATADLYTAATITGANLAITGGNVQIGHQSLGTGASFYIRALLDLRGLAELSYNNPAGTFSVAGGGQRRQGGELFLANVNNITASAMPVGYAAPGVASGTGKLHLGTTNNLFVNTITTARLQIGSLIDFQPDLVNAVANVRGADGIGGVANWYIGWNSAGQQAASTANGTNDFSGGILNAVVTNLQVGYFSSGDTGSGKSATGSLMMGNSSQNRLEVQNLFLGNIPYAAPISSFTAKGTLSSGGGTIIAGSVTMAQQGGLGLSTGLLLLTNTTMQIAGDLVEGGGTSTITVSQSTLDVGGLIGSPTATVDTFTLENATLGLTLIAPGDYTKAAASTAMLMVEGSANSTVITINNPSVSPGQYPLISYTSLGGAAGFAGLRVQAPLGTSATLVNNTTGYPYTIDVVITADQLVWNGDKNNDWDIGGTANWKNNTLYTEPGGIGKRVLFDDTAAGSGSVVLTTVLSPLGTTVQNASKTYTFTGAGRLTGIGGLNKQGAGTLILAQAGENDYSGTTAIGAGGKLQLGNGGTTGSLGSGPVSVDGTLEFNRSDDLLLTNPVTGGGSISKSGANTVTLAGSASYSGPTTISGGTLAFTHSGTDTLAGNISGGGRLAKGGTGTLLLTGVANTYSGGTLITSGTLQIGDGINLGSLPAGNIVNDGTLAFNGTFYTLPNNISGSGGVISFGSGSFFTLSGANTYTGPTTIINGGTLTLGSANGMPPQSVLTLGETSGVSIGSINCANYNVTIGGLHVGGNQAGANQILLGSGNTLTINGNFTIGNTASAGARANLAVVGMGAAIVVNTNGGFIQMGQNTSGAGTGANNVNCDLTTLDSFVVNLGSTGIIRLGEVNLATANNTPQQVLRLANSNSITAGSIWVGAGGKGITPELHLGSGTNILNVSNLVIATSITGGRDSGKVLFEGSTGSLRIRGQGGEATRAHLHMLVGGGVTTTATATNLFDVSGHYADLLLEQLWIGDQVNRTGTSSNYFGFDQGILDANQVYLGRRAGAAGISVMRIGGGQVRFGSLDMASRVAASGLLDIAGGQVTIDGDVAKNGVGAASINVVNASLLIKGRVASEAYPLSDLALDGVTFSVGRLAGFGNPTTALVQASNLNLSGSCTIKLTGTNYAVGQFPLFRYGTLGGVGYGAITAFVPPPGVTATLVNNPGSQTIDVNITSAPPQSPRASLTAVATGGSLALSWSELGLILQTNAVDVASPASWFNFPGSTTVTNLGFPINPEATNVFYRLVYP